MNFYSSIGPFNRFLEIFSFESPRMIPITLSYNFGMRNAAISRIWLKVYFRNNSESPKMTTMSWTWPVIHIYSFCMRANMFILLYTFILWYLKNHPGQKSCYSLFSKRAEGPNKGNMSSSFGIPYSLWWGQYFPSPLRQNPNSLNIDFILNQSSIFPETIESLLHA